MSLILQAVVASLVYQQSPSQEPAPFTRTYTLKEQCIYSLSMDLPNDSFVKGLKATISVNVVKFLPDKTPQVAFKTLKYVDLNNPAKSKQPDSQTCLIEKYNIPANIRIMDTNMVYLFLAAASPTPDKVIKVGDEIPMEMSFPDGKLELKGKGKFLSVDAAKRTATIEWTYNSRINNMDMGTMKFTSTYDQANYALIKSTGAMNFGGPDGLSSTVNITKTVTEKVIK